ncbi:hypothetical protein U6A24_16910 [Aquimarina gracilis]|uniref:Lipocalin-like protein n=1 Tax=Aquimarina gracilis TaxID=874422 RepID=A0ABU5ZZ26_9FLAO|nr:hypothetical protein [Aquimarina gracilis]MEB3347157.1 hypothetical protein [Aquimarina gracilis]
MRKLLRAYATRWIVLLLIFYSCGSSGAKAPEVTITGSWKLIQEYSNEGEDTPLKEFLLSTCDKETTLEIFDTGKFLEKSYYENSSMAGECAKDSQDTNGKWKKSTNGMYLFMYQKNNALMLKGATVTIEKGNLVVNAIYNDKDLGPKTQLRFIYARVQ